MIVRHRLPVLVGAVVACASLSAAPAHAHVEPSVTEIPANSEATVEFTVEHGCDGSPTVKVEFQVPAEIVDATPVDKEGWTGSTDGRVVTFEGGPLDAETPDRFSVRFTAPDAAGATLAFPFLQTCEQGSIDWIQTGEGAERPAPLVAIGPGPDPTTTAAPTTVPGDDATTTAAPTTTIAPATTTSLPAGADEDDGADAGGGRAGLVIGVLVATAGAIGFGVWLRRREA